MGSPAASVTRRVAWIGPSPSTEGGVPYLSTQLLQALVMAGAEVDAYVDAVPDQLPSALRGLDGLTPVCQPMRWEWDRWYSSTDSAAFVSGLALRAWHRRSQAEALVRAHRQRPYDLVYCFSNIELAGLRRFEAQLPPIVIHPEVHAAGELRWLLRERHLLAPGAASRLRAGGAVAVQGLRSLVQRRDIRRAARVIAPSAVFAELLAGDYGVDRRRISVVPNVIDTDRFAPGPLVPRDPPLRLLFVGRMSVRKGVELIVELSRRLEDLRDEVVIEAVGGHTLWSDYRHLLPTTDDGILRYVGPLSPDDLATRLRSADALIQPSLYEPFALTVGEALSSGTPVVVSDAVGAGEELPPECCERFRSGDVDDLEAALRRLIERLGTEPDVLRTAAREQAVRLFGVGSVSAALRAALDGVAPGPT